MNLFILSDSAEAAAMYQCDKHVNKMIIETAQMLSTAHRYLDGKMFVELSKAGRRTKKWDHPTYDSILYKSTHVNHPSAVWIRQTAGNYNWAYHHFVALCNEYYYRFGKSHATGVKLLDILRLPPTNISHGGRTPFSIAINYDLYPSVKTITDPVDAYRQYYVCKHLEQFNMTWTRVNQPYWFNDILNETLEKAA